MISWLARLGWRRFLVIVRWLGDRDRVANDNAFVPDQDLLDNQADNPLPLLNVEGVGRATQLGEECREGLSETQIDSAIVDLIEDRLQFGSDPLLCSVYLVQVHCYRTAGDPRSSQRSRCLSASRSVHSAFLAKLRSSADTLDIQERQRIVRLIVKEILIGDESIIVRHSTPVSQPPNDNQKSAPSQSGKPGDQSYLLRSGRDDPTLRRTSLSPDDTPIRQLHRGFRAICQCTKAPMGSPCAAAPLASEVPIDLVEETLISISRTQSEAQQRCRALTRASCADFPGR